MKRALCLLVVLVLAFSMLAGCGAAGSSSENTTAVKSSEAQATRQATTQKASPEDKKVTLTHLTWSVADSGGAFDDILKKFKDEHPNITVEIQNIASDQYYSTLQTRLLSGDAPDIITTGPGGAQYGTQSKNGYLLDITNEPMIQNVLPNTLQSVTIDGKIYGIPYGVASLVVLYNKKIFAENGLKVPENYQEMLQLCETLKSKKITPIAYGIKDSYVAQFLPYQIAPTAVYSKNANWDKDLVAGKDKFDSPEWKRVFDIPFELKDKGYLSPNALGVGDQQSVEMFARGDAAMTFTGTWATGTARAANKDIDIGVFPFPANQPGEERWMTVAVGSILAISSTSKHIDESKQYLSAWASKDYAQIWTDKAKTISTIKGVNNSYDPIMNDLTPYLEQLKTWPFANQGWPNEEITTVFLKSFQDVYAGNLTVEGMLKAMDDAVKKK